MKKKIITFGFAACVLIATAIFVNAVTNLFATKTITSEFEKKHVFQLDIDAGLTGGKIGPGDTFSVSPVICNDATEEMYVFLEIGMPTVENSGIYSFDADKDWTLVESTGGTIVYAYASPDMTVLQPGERTTALTTKMTMNSISNAEYAAIEDINFTITGYAIGKEDVSTKPEDAWNVCKTIGNIT